MKKFVSARWLAALLVLAATALVTGCGNRPYHTTEYNYAGRAIPPSKLLQRVLVIVGNSNVLTSGSAQMIDASRDIRFNVYQPNSTFPISGFSTTGVPTQLFNYPEQQLGIVFASDRSVGSISYATEAFTSATLASSVFASTPTSLFVPSDRAFAYAAEETSGLFLVDDLGAGAQYNFSLPGAYRVAVNPSHTVVLIMTRNTDNVYRLLRLNTGQTPPANAVDCQPLNQPIYCVLPVGSSQANGSVSEPAFHRPQYAYFSPDGSQAYILSCGRECGGTGNDAQPAIHFANTASLRTDAYPTSSVYTTPVVQTVNLPGATAAISDGNTVYVAGQQLLSDGYFSGVLSVLPAGATSPSGTYAISDGTHTKMLFADDNTLWIGAQNCASGERKVRGQNYNCLSVYNTSAKSTNVVPNVTPGSSTTVANPNENLDPYYYGSLTGICWVEGQHKIYTAYGGQLHAFHTADNSELDNTNFTVQGTAIDVGYMDASTNVAN